jgi:diadenosine tetraphosphate (Ap4A) HIT family hydrolase
MRGASHNPRMIDTPCIACAINNGNLVPPGGPIYIDELWQADHELTPLLPGYVILKPRRHVHELADLSDAESATLGPVMRRLLAAMRSVLAPQRIYVVSFAETVHHLHFHLIPRYQDMPALGPDLLRDVLAGRWRCDARSAAGVATQIRDDVAAG